MTVVVAWTLHNMNCGNLAFHLLHAYSLPSILQYSTACLPIQKAKQEELAIFQRNTKQTTLQSLLQSKVFFK